MSWAPVEFPAPATMLSVVPQRPQDLHYHQQQQYLPQYYPSTTSYRAMPHRVHPDEVAAAAYPSPVSMPAGSPRPSPQLQRAILPHQEPAVAQALEIARESPDGAQDPTIAKILEHAITDIWMRVQAQPDSYTMSRPEFAVFNFFQHRFVGDKIAIAARRRYWDNTYA